MPKFMFIYHGGMPRNHEEAVASRLKWKTWFSSLGPAVVDPGKPVRSAKGLTESGAPVDRTTSPISGFSIVAADSEQAAFKLAERCPILKENGTIDIAEVIDI